MKVVGLKGGFQVAGVPEEDSGPSVSCSSDSIRHSAIANGLALGLKAAESLTETSETVIRMNTFSCLI